ncbi:DEAD-box ATP-dependent RNA helicase 32 isoform X1 [Morus notabilis]|uniref:DEAD-box ATP-dependent RNA helicase 32 isoform X1 n=1 Tax=Morus notabilis TaxID=981085 RepID=UPI000CED14B1|nr:DEAD-box ATP-dependent RNA helicase 32 isoform X1 [Morus notabilis]
MRKPKSTPVRKQSRPSEDYEIELLNSWINAQKPDRGSNPLSLPPLPSDAPVGCLLDGGAASFSRFSGARMFSQLPLSRRTMKGLRQSKYLKMTEIQTASLPHALAGRDVLLAAKESSGRILAFVIPVVSLLSLIRPPSSSHHAAPTSHRCTSC